MTQNRQYGGMMKDRFRFRHYNHLTKKMTYYDKPGIQVCLNGDFKSGLIFPLSEDIEDNAIYMGNYTYYQQCTGLKDKNGKLIFEGDIVMYSGKAGIIKEISSTLVCYWLKDYLSNDGWYNYLPYFEHNDIKLEVVGNIYENPELLKGGV